MQDLSLVYARPPLPAAVVCGSLAHHATTMFFPHFVGDEI
jgi:hypothetical protein